MVSPFMVNEADPSLASLLDAASSGALTSAPPFETGRALRKSLASTGHLVDRFLTACQALMARVQRMPELLPYFHGFDFAASPVMHGEGIFACPLHLCEDHLKLHPLLLTVHQTQQAVTAWHRVQLDAPKTAMNVLEVPAIANAPLWPALLHLRPLHGFWEQELRRSHVETLLQRVPHAWMLDPTPLPPGAVIPKLELPSWQKLVPHDRFTIQDTTADREGILPDSSRSATEWKNSIDRALQSFDRHPQVLAESSGAPGTLLLGLYQRHHQRVDSIGGIALHQDETSAWRLSRW